MKTIYLIKTGKNEDDSPAWRELTGREFYQLIHSDGTEKRRFIEITPEFQNEDRIIIEATEEQLLDWSKERNRTAYLKRWKAKRGYRVVPLSDLSSEYKCRSEDKFADPDVDVEAEVLNAIRRDELQTAIRKLPQAERLLVEELLRCHMEIGIRDLSRALGLPYSTVRSRINRAMKHLRKMLQEY